MGKYISLKEKLNNFFHDISNSAISQDDKNQRFWVYLAGNVVLTLFFMNIFFWMLWTIIVYKGGFFIKIVPLLKVIFTSRTFRDYGYEGWPYEPGIFDGLVENFIALILLLMFVYLCWIGYKKISNRFIMKG